MPPGRPPRGLQRRRRENSGWNRSAQGGGGHRRGIALACGIFFFANGKVYYLFLVLREVGVGVKGKVVRRIYCTFVCMHEYNLLFLFYVAAGESFMRGGSIMSEGRAYPPPPAPRQSRVSCQREGNPSGQTCSSLSCGCCPKSCTWCRGIFRVYLCLRLSRGPL